MHHDGAAARGSRVPARPPALQGEVGGGPAACGSSLRGSRAAWFKRGVSVTVQWRREGSWRASGPAAEKRLVFTRKQLLVTQLVGPPSSLASLPIRVSFIFRTPARSVLIKKLIFLSGLCHRCLLSEARPGSPATFITPPCSGASAGGRGGRARAGSRPRCSPSGHSNCDELSEASGVTNVFETFSQAHICKK